VLSVKQKKRNVDKFDAGWFRCILFRQKTKPRILSKEVLTGSRKGGAVQGLLSFAVKANSDPKLNISTDFSLIKNNSEQGV